MPLLVFGMMRSEQRSTQNGGAVTMEHNLRLNLLWLLAISFTLASLPAFGSPTSRHLNLDTELYSARLHNDGGAIWVGVDLASIETFSHYQGSKGARGTSIADRASRDQAQELLTTHRIFQLPNDTPITMLSFVDSSINDADGSAIEMPPVVTDQGEGYWKVKLSGGPYNGAQVWTHHVAHVSPQVGETVLIRSGVNSQKYTLAAFDSFTASSFWEAIDHGDNTLAASLLRLNRLFSITSKAMCLVMDENDDFYQVRVLNGTNRGKAGWILKANALLKPFRWTDIGQGATIGLGLAMQGRGQSVAFGTTRSLSTPAKLLPRAFTPPTKLADRTDPEVIGSWSNIELPEFDPSTLSSTSVLVSIEVLSTGLSNRVTLEHSSGNSDVDRAVKDAISRMRFRPAVHNGKPIMSTLQHTITLFGG